MQSPTAQDYANFKPRDYLNYYYTRIDDENRNLLEFFADAYKGLPPDSKMIEFGGGPTIYQIISAAKEVAQIDFADYLDANLDEVRSWKDKAEDAFDWDPFVRRALEIEGSAVNEETVAEREALIRTKLGSFRQADAFLADPIGPESRSKYDVMGLIFVPEGITDSKDDWKTALTNIVSLLKPGGIFVTAAILGADFWHSGPQVLPAVNLSESDFTDTLPQLGLTIKIQHTISSEIPDPKDPNYTGYSGMVFIKAVKA